MAERHDTKSYVMLGGFQSQLEAPYVSSHAEELGYTKQSVDDNIYAPPERSSLWRRN